MHHSHGKIIPQFFVTALQPCAYLDHQAERKLFTALRAENGEILHNTLAKQGFRRSQNVIYRPACDHCNACISVRIRVADFVPSKSQKRILKKNMRLDRSVNTPKATKERFRLFEEYITQRHQDGGMSDMSYDDFEAMIEESHVKTALLEYREASDQNLQGCSLTDFQEDGLSLVYSFFSHQKRQDSLGTYIILDHIAYARELGLEYVYLGYWIKNSPKMQYKNKFSALEGYFKGEWKDITEIETVIENKGSLRVDLSVADQLNTLKLP